MKFRESVVFLNQAVIGPYKFIETAFVCMSVCMRMCVYVFVSIPENINNQWHDMV